MKKYVLALDQGTTSSRCIIFSKNCEIVSKAHKEFTQYYPNPGWVEHDPMEIWSTQISVAIEAIQQKQIECDEIAAVGITNQRETTIIWDRNTGKPICNAIVWQCRRTAKMIDAIKEDAEFAGYIQKTTGLIPDAYFSASKIAWILENVPGAREKAEAGELLFGTVDTWLIWNLSGGTVHVTDYTNASRTMLFDIRKLCWDKRILEYFGIPVSLLPDVKPSSCVYGYTDEKVFGGKVPIAGAAGDQQAALFGQCCFNKGDIKNTYGTGGFLLMNTDKTPVESKYGLLTTIAASLEDNITYALEGSIFIAGAGIQWLRDELKIIEDAPSTEEIALSVEDTNGVYLVPAFTGLGAPYWNPYARGCIVGLTRGCKRAHFVRAALEAMAYQSRDLIELMEKESDMPISSINVDGGASLNNFLMQFQADISEKVVIRPSCIETTAMGAAFLAGLAAGLWKDREDLKDCISDGRAFMPAMDKEKREKLIKGWEQAVDTTIYNANCARE
ncbi:MAG: glycerol kinase GlpK [Lachnospiraceae bacterium]|nr:glycerol kinase GlpK [Lachnospiraceae bacterium]